MVSFGQSKRVFSIYAQLNPELCFHKDNYSSFRLSTVNRRVTANTGVEAGIEYNITQKIFVNAGAGFIARKLTASAFLDQGRLPPPQGSPSAELVNTAAVIFRTLQLPVTAGYRFIAKEKNACFVYTGLTGNFLMNTYYKLNAFRRYQGAYRKNYWQGVSVLLGLGADHQLNKRLRLSGKIGYSVINTVKNDEYLFSQDEDVIDLPHTYLTMSAGIKISLQ